MPDRDAETQLARNRLTLVVARFPLGLKPRLEQAAEEDGSTVSAWVAAAVEERLQRREARTKEGSK